MHKFKDFVNVTVSSGNGGPGCVSFLRERFNAKGGPDGGNGGKGGDVIFKAKSDLYTLSLYKNGHKFAAKNGKPGMGLKKSGASGKDLILFIPLNTRIYDKNTKSLLFETQSCNDELVILKGGKGGLGNSNFKTSVRRTPRFAQLGESGKCLELRLVFSLKADIGLVGFPNAGKSSILNKITAARSKVANYPFTTIIPCLGVLRYSSNNLVIVDIPGIIEGSSHGVGFGFEFLRHISKAKILAFVIDISEADFLKSYNTLLNELRSYSIELFNKKRIIIANKLDLDGSERNFKHLRRVLKGEKIIGISIYENRGINELIKGFLTCSKS